VNPSGSGNVRAGVEAAPDDAQACPAWEESIGAAAAGWLSDRESAALTAHTAECPGCATELDELSDLGLWLATVARGPARQPRLRRRLWSRVSASLVAAAAAAAVVWGVVAPNPARLVEFTRTAPGASASAELTGSDAGTRVRLAATGLDPDAAHTLWLARRGDGVRIAVTTVYTDGRGALAVTADSPLPLTEAARVWVTDPAGATVLAGA
jgi:hypothetical protein